MVTTLPRTLSLGITHICTERMADELSSDHYGVKHSISYFNRTTSDIEVRDRLGFVQIVPSISKVSGRTFNTRGADIAGFFIHYRVDLNECDFQRAMKYYERLQAESTVFRSIYNELYERNHNRNTRGQQEIEVVVRLRDRDFQEFNVAGDIVGHSPVYLEEFGISVGVLDALQDMKCPDSVEDVIKYRNNATTLALKDSLDDSALISIEAIDNSGCHTYQKLYVSLCNQVLEIPIRYNSNDGTHGVIIRSHPTVEMMKRDPRIKRTDIISQVFSFEDAFEKFGIHTSVDGASSHGDSKRSIERELTEKQLELKRMDVRLAELQRVSKIEEEERKRKTQELDDQRIALRRQQEEMDYDRKRENDRIADERQRLKEDRAALEAELTHQRTVDKLTMDGTNQTRKYIQEQKLVEEKGFWDGITTVLKLATTVIGIGGGLTKLLCT